MVADTRTPIDFLQYGISSPFIVNSNSWEMSWVCTHDLVTGSDSEMLLAGREAARFVVFFTLFDGVFFVFFTIDISKASGQGHLQTWHSVVGEVHVLKLVIFQSFIFAAEKCFCGNHPVNHGDTTQMLRRTPEHLQVSTNECLKMLKIEHPWHPTITPDDLTNKGEDWRHRTRTLTIGLEWNCAISVSAHPRNMV